MGIEALITIPTSSDSSERHRVDTTSVGAAESSEREVQLVTRKAY